MHGRSILGGILAALVLAAPATAHNLSLNTPSGDLGTFFRFSGRAWQPGGRVAWEYQPSTRSATVTQSGTFTAGSKGRFRFTWSDGRPGLTHRMCFTQFDTRFASSAGTPPGRRFRKCASFYVALPSAFYTPSAGVPGDPFVLLATGFPPGRNLQVTVRGPDSAQAADTFAMTTATRSAFSPPGPYGPVFVPRGGAAAARSSSNSGAGLYTAEIREPNSGLVAYASARLTR